ncbi:MAG: glycosyltransferase family 4 protein [Planctomycetota bacterium]
MKILYVVHQFFPECWSGTEQYCLAVAREARARGHDVTILALEPDLAHDEEPLRLIDRPYDGFRVLRLRPWWGLSPNDTLRDYHQPAIAARVRALLRDEHFDVMHVFHLRWLGSEVLEVGRDAGCRVIVHLMDFWFLCPRFTLLRSDGALCNGPPRDGLDCVACAAPELATEARDLLEEPLSSELLQSLADHRPQPAARWTTRNRVTALVGRKTVQLARLARAHAVIAPSHFLAKTFVDNGFSAERITVIPYGLDPMRVVREAVDRPRAPLRIAFAGVFSPWKSPDVVIRAVRAIDSDLRLDLWGNDREQAFADYIARCRRLAADDPRIAFRGTFDESRRNAVLAETDVLVVPSTWYENTPFVMLEAFAAGVPVVASDLGGMSELVQPGRNGFLFPAGDAEALGNILGDLAREPRRLRTLEVRPPSTVADAFDRFEAFYAINARR